MRRTLSTAVATMCLLPVIAIGLSSGGCDDLLSSGAGTGTLTMLVTDKPFPFEFITEASVVITRVEVRATSSDSATDNENGDEGVDGDGSDNENENDNGDAEANENDNGDDPDSDAGSGEGGDSFVVVFEDEEGLTFNLLELQNGVAASLVETDLPAGGYSQVRLIVASGHIVLEDGREFDLNVPSGEQTGIKIKVPFEIDVDENTTLLVDIDLSKAFVPIPGGAVNEASEIQSFTFKPSQAVRIVELQQTGFISGTVTDDMDGALENVSVTVFLDGEEVTSTATTAEGTYIISGLEAGTYTIEFSLAGWQDGSLSDVEVTAGEEADAGTVALTP